jgi:ubiquinol-cytochrome c reductase cytochrome b subunit
MKRGPLDWVATRLSCSGAWQAFLNHPLPHAASWGQTIGPLILYVFCIEAIVGTVLALFYSPSVSSAWASVAYLEDQVHGGWFLRGIHHQGMNALVILSVLYLLRGIWLASYRRPRELSWLSGILLLPVVLAFGMSGYLLSFDQNAYWAAQVRVGIAHGLPFGSELTRFLLGGTELGNLSLLRAYVGHILILPGVFAACAAIHLRSEFSARMGSQASHGTYLQKQAFRDLAAMTALAGILGIVTYAEHGAPLWAPADPNSTFLARPEWYFLPLFQLLHVLEGPWQIVGSAILPALLMLGAAALPFLDAGKERSGSSWWVRLLFLALMAAATLLSGWALALDRADPEFAKAMTTQREQASKARMWAKSGVLPEGGAAVWQNDPDYRARVLFREHCETCHAIDGIGGEEAPALDHFADRAWLQTVIRNPRDPLHFGRTKHEGMDPYPEKDLSPDDLGALIEYLVSLRTSENVTFDSARAKVGASVFADQGCEDCHEIKTGSDGDGPNLNEHGTRLFVYRVIHDPKAADLYGDEAEMPAFAAKLAPNDMALLADFVVRTRRGEVKVDVAEIVKAVEMAKSAQNAPTGKKDADSEENDDGTAATENSADKPEDETTGDSPE